MNEKLVVSQSIHKKICIPVVGVVVLLMVALVGIYSNERAHASGSVDQKNKHFAMGSISATSGATPLVLEFDVKKSKNDQYVILPIHSYGKVEPNVVIEWGDGKTETVTEEGYIRHNYDKPGRYRVTVSGVLPKFGRNLSAFSYEKHAKAMQHLIKVLSFGDLQTESYEAVFSYAPRLIEVPKEFPQTVIDTSQMFQGATIFNHPNITHWNVSNVTKMSGMFANTARFNQPIGTWDVSNVTAMDMMFGSTKAFNQPLAQWNTGNVENLADMFGSAEKFNQNINTWDISNVHWLSRMFTNARQFNQPLGDWDTSSVWFMTQTFEGAKKFNQPLDTWDTSRVIDMTKMFNGASSFNQSLENWDLSSLMFYHCNFCNAKLLHQRLDTWDNWSGKAIKFPKQNIILSEQQPLPWTIPIPKAGGEGGGGTFFTNTPAYEKFSVRWSPLLKNGLFEEGIAYTATIEAFPVVGYTLQGVKENSFFLPGISDAMIEGITITNKADSGIITVVFPPVKQSEKINENPVDVSAEKPVEVAPTEKPVETPIEKPVEKPAEKPAEKPVEVAPTEKPTVHPADAG